MSKNSAFTSAQELFDHAVKELKRGSIDRNSHFKWPALSTFSKTGPEVRTIVLRDFDIYDHKARLYSDSRAGKVEQLAIDPRCQLLFFSPRSLTQVRAAGTAFFLDDQIEKQRLWEAIPCKAKRDYLSLTPPGTAIPSPDLSSQELASPDLFAYPGHTLAPMQTSPTPEKKSKNTDKVWFSVIDIHIDHYDILKLDRPDHLRIGAIRKENFTPFFKIP